MGNDYRCQCGRMLIKDMSVSGYFIGSIKCNSCKRINLISVSSPDRDTAWKPMGMSAGPAPLTASQNRGTVEMVTK